MKWPIAKRTLMIITELEQFVLWFNVTSAPYTYIVFRIWRSNGRPKWSLSQSAAATVFPVLLLKDQTFNEQFVKTTLLSAERSSSANKRQESELWILIFCNHLPGTSKQGFSIFSAFFESSLMSRGSLGVSAMLTLAVLIGFTSVENPLGAVLKENFLLLADNMSCLLISCYREATVYFPHFNKVFCSINWIWHLISVLYMPEKTLLTSGKEHGVSHVPLKSHYAIKIALTWCLVVALCWGSVLP